MLMFHLLAEPSADLVCWHTTHNIGVNQVSLGWITGGFLKKKAECFEQSGN